MKRLMEQAAPSCTGTSSPLLLPPRRPPRCGPADTHRPSVATAAAAACLSTGWLPMYNSLTAAARSALRTQASCWPPALAVTVPSGVRGELQARQGCTEQKEPTTLCLTGSHGENNEGALAYAAA